MLPTRRPSPEAAGETLCPRGQTGPARSGEPEEPHPSVPPVNLNLAGFGQHVDDVCLEVSVMHPCLPELPGVAVVLPVVVPVAPAVGAEPEDVHL